MASTINETLVGYGSFTVSAAPALTLNASSNLNFFLTAIDDISVRIGPPELTNTNAPAVPAFNVNTPNVADPWRLAFVNAGVENPYYKIVVTLFGNGAPTAPTQYTQTRLGDTTWQLTLFTNAGGNPTTAYGATVSVYSVSLN